MPKQNGVEGQSSHLPDRFACEHHVVAELRIGASDTTVDAVHCVPGDEQTAGPIEHRDVARGMPRSLDYLETEGGIAIANRNDLAW